MLGRNYSRQFKLDCIQKVATRLQPARNVPLSAAASRVLPRASCYAGEQNLRRHRRRFRSPTLSIPPILATPGGEEDIRWEAVCYQGNPRSGLGRECIVVTVEYGSQEATCDKIRDCLKSLNRARARPFGLTNVGQSSPTFRRWVVRKRCFRSLLPLFEL